MVLKVYEPSVMSNNQKKSCCLFTQLQASSNIEKSVPNPSRRFLDHPEPSNNLQQSHEITQTYLWPWLRGYDFCISHRKNEVLFEGGFDKIGHPGRTVWGPGRPFELEGIDKCGEGFRHTHVLRDWGIHVELGSPNLKFGCPHFDCKRKLRDEDP